MRLWQKARLTDEKVVIETKHDWDVHVKESKAIRDNGVVSPNNMSDSYHLARLPMDLITIWAKEKGIDWSDEKAMEEMIIAKINDPEYKKFRNWEGKV